MAERKLKSRIFRNKIGTLFDLSPMDFGMNGMFKARKVASTVKQLVKVAKAERKSVELFKIQKTLRVWTERVGFVEGFRTEHFRV